MRCALLCVRILISSDNGEHLTLSAGGDIIVPNNRLLFKAFQVTGCGPHIWQPWDLCQE
jgi:hypothetical protein